MQRRKPYKAKGAVLIMVLTVMFVLIFLLAGAVAVVYSSNRRVMVQYEESQAYYTARSVLDVYHDMILASDDTSKVTGNYYELDKTTYEVTPSTTYPNISSGRALELDLYRVPVSVNATIGEANFNKTFADDYNAAADDAARSAVVRSRNMTEDVAATATGANIADYLKQYTVTGSQSSKYSVGDADANQIASVTDWSGASPKYAVGKDDTLVYYVNYDKTNNESNFSKYQGTPTGSNSAANKLTDPGSTVKLTVQVIDRVYDLSTDAAFTTFGDQFVHGNREKDYFIIKVTAEVVYDGQIVTTSAVYENQQRTYPSPPASKAIVSMSDISGQNSLCSFGGASALKRGTVSLTSNNNMNTEGNIFLQSDLKIADTKPNIYLDGESTMFVRGKLTTTNNPLFSDNTRYKTGCLLYANQIEMSDKGLIDHNKTYNQYVNIIGQELKITASNDCQIFGVGIFDTIDLTKDAGHTAVENCVGNKKKIFRGKNYYCNYLWVTKDMLDLSVPSSPKLKSDYLNLVDSGSTLTVTQGIKYMDGATETIINGSGVKFNNGTDTSKGEIVLDTNTSNLIKVNYETDATELPSAANNYQKKFTLPTSIKLIDKDGNFVKNEFTLDTVQSLYGTYFKDDDGGSPAVATWNANGDFNLSDADLNNETTYRAFIDSHIKTAEDIFTDLNSQSMSAFSTSGTADSSFKYDDPAGNEQSFNLTGTWNIISGTKFYVPQDSYPCSNKTNYVIDARTSPVTIQFGTAASNTGDVYFNGHFVVVGQKEVSVLIPSNNAGTKVHFGHDNGEFEFFDMDIGLTPTSLVLSGSGATAAPNIKWYVSKNVEQVELYQKTLGSISGYFTAPTTEFYQHNMTGSKPTITSEAFGTTNLLDTTNQAICVVGSVLCKNFKQEQDKKAGVCYINEANAPSGASPGKPLYNWPAQYYTMN